MGRREPCRIHTLLSTSHSMTFFMAFSSFSIPNRFSCHFQKFSNCPCFGVLFDLKQLNRHKLCCPPKCMPNVALLNYSSLSYIVLALSSAITKLLHKTSIFHDFPALENEILKFHDFPGFPWTVRILTLGATLLPKDHQVSENIFQHVGYWVRGCLAYIQ